MFGCVCVFNNKQMEYTRPLIPLLRMPGQLSKWAVWFCNLVHCFTFCKWECSTDPLLVQTPIQPSVHCLLRCLLCTSNVTLPPKSNTQWVLQKEKVHSNHFLYNRGVLIVAKCLTVSSTQTSVGGNSERTKNKSVRRTFIFLSWHSLPVSSCVVWLFFTFPCASHTPLTVRTLTRPSVVFMLTFLHVHLNNMCGTPGPRLNQNNCSQKNLLLHPVILKQKEFCFAICYSHGLCLWTQQEITKWSNMMLKCKLHTGQTGERHKIQIYFVLLVPVRYSSHCSCVWGDARVTIPHEQQYTSAQPTQAHYNWIKSFHILRTYSPGTYSPWS